MPNEMLEVEEKVKTQPKKRGRKSKYAADNNKITGDLNKEAFTLALSDIERDSLVSASKVAEILVNAMSQAYLEWSYPEFKEKDNLDPFKQLVKCKVVFSDDISSFKIFDTKIVTEEDDIIDDSYQVSLEDAREISPDAQLGDQIDIPFDVKQLDKSYVRRVKQLFQAKLKEASKQAITSVYSNQIGELIYGKVIKVEKGDKNANATYQLSFGKADGYLHYKQLIPGDKFAVGDNVLVYLINVSDKSNPPSLAITRSSEKFVMKLFERAVPELSTGVIKIKAISREAGKRTKIFVESTNPNIDPVGTCIGPESSRAKTVLNNLNSEKVDILKYQSNKALQIIEAMKPAQVIGLACPEDFFDPNVHFDEIEKERNYEFPAVTAVVSSGNSGVAIGTGGVNVRLASTITMCTISVKTADEAIKEKLKYMLLPDIEREAQEWAGITASEEKLQEISEENKDIETQTEEETPFLEPVTELGKSASSENHVMNEETSEQETISNNIVNEDTSAQKPTPTSTTSEIKSQAQDVEHIEIKNKPKISLEELEQVLSQKKGPAETRSYKKHRKEEEKEEETTSIAKNVQAMPIYTQEELEEIKAQELEEENDYDDYDDELEEYDSDSYYDEDNGK